MYKRNSFVCGTAAVLTAAVMSIPASAELSLPEIIWQDGIAFDKASGTVLSDCAAFDSSENTEDRFVLIGPNGTEMKRAGSYAELVNADKTDISTLEIKADVPEGFNVPVIILIENDIGNEYEIKLYDYNGYKSLTNLDTGRYTVNDCFVQGDNKGRYAIEAAAQFELPEDGTLLNISVDDTNPAIPYTEERNNENKPTGEGINNISFPEENDIHTETPRLPVSPDPTLAVIQRIEPQSAGEMGKTSFYTNPPQETMINFTVPPENNTPPAKEKSDSGRDIKIDVWKPIAVDVLTLVIFFAVYFAVKKFVIKNRSDRRD